jgi:hypothetical protein
MRVFQCGPACQSLLDPENRTEIVGKPRFVTRLSELEISTALDGSPKHIQATATRVAISRFGIEIYCEINQPTERRLWTPGGWLEPP